MRLPAGVLVLLSVTVAVALSRTDSARGGDRDCDDFSTQGAAQDYFESIGGSPSNNADLLDADGDGIACEDLPAGGGGSGGGGGGGKSDKPDSQRIRAKVIGVTDGDTIKVRAYGTKRNRYDVRLIGIDTPEKFGGLECGARQASGAMKDQAPNRTRIVLRTDPTQDMFDRYGRLLAYANKRSNGRDLGKRQIASGWAKVYVFERRFRRTGSYRGAARKARNANRGVWDLCGGGFHQPL